MPNFIPYFLVFAALLAGGCTTTPDAVRDASVEDVAVAQVQTAPEGYRGVRVRWGGSIVAVYNRAEATVVEVLSRRLRASAAPDPDAAGEGRFRARIPGFVDPSEYSEGRWLTVVGSVRGVERGSVGEHPYVFPLVEVEHHRLWRSRDEIIPPPAPCYYGPWWDPWYPWRPYPYPYGPCWW